MFLQMRNVKMDDKDLLDIPEFLKREVKESETIIEENTEPKKEESVELINICPKTMSELRSFTFGWKKLILSETLEKILKLSPTKKDHILFDTIIKPIWEKLPFGGKK